MANRLRGKVALISGGARGQGAAEARIFSEEGARVVVGDVLGAPGGRLCDDINRKAGAATAQYVPLDVTRAADWKHAVATAERTFGGLDVLVNYAGIFSFAGVFHNGASDLPVLHTPSGIAVNERRDGLTPR